MDRFVVREPRVGTECLQGNQIIAYPTNTAGNNTNMIPDQMYYGSFASEYPVRIDNTRFLNTNKQYQTNLIQGQATSGQGQIISGQRQIPGPGQNIAKQGQAIPGHGQIMPSHGQIIQGRSQILEGHGQIQPGQGQIMQGQGQIMSGIDPNYLANYGNNSAEFIFGPNQIQRENQNTQFHENPFGSEYQNRNIQIERNNVKTFTTQTTSHGKGINQSKYVENPRSINIQTPKMGQAVKINFSSVNTDQSFKNQFQPQTPVRVTSVSSDNSNEMKKELQNQVMTRSDKLKALHKSGPRSFSGPVEKVLKWHKALQDVGVLVIYEIVAKCVSIRTGESCSKNLVIRDDNGPAMQVVYYEIDFLLPDLKLPCTVRVVGRMMPGTNRLQAFNVRPATGDDVATLPRRAAVASHHIAKLCKEFGVKIDKI